MAEICCILVLFQIDPLHLFPVFSHWLYYGDSTVTRTIPCKGLYDREGGWIMADGSVCNVWKICCFAVGFTAPFV